MLMAPPHLYCQGLYILHQDWSLALDVHNEELTCQIWMSFFSIGQGSDETSNKDFCLFNKSVFSLTLMLT